MNFNQRLSLLQVTRWLPLQRSKFEYRIMGALATHQRSSTILDKGPSSDFRMRIVHFHSPPKQAKVHHTVPLFTNLDLPMTTNIAAAQAAHCMDFANSNKSDHNP